MIMTKSVVPFLGQLAAKPPINKTRARSEIAFVFSAKGVRDEIPNVFKTKAFLVHKSDYVFSFRQLTGYARNVIWKMAPRSSRYMIPTLVIVTGLLPAFVTVIVVRRIASCAGSFIVSIFF